MLKSLYTEIAGKKYRLGYTTGTCSAAAAMAAVMLFEGKKSESVVINTPYGIDVEIDIIYSEKNNNYAVCGVVKDGGDDYDVTSGIKIYAKAQLTEGETFVTGGEGIGIVTKKGLKCNVGEYAINPEPIKMIKKAVSSVSDKNYKITIYAPEGVDIAKKTFNPRLGIQGGISIIGTTGIVTPMSEEAWKESCSYELSVKKASGKKSVCFVFGNYGEVFATKYLGINKDCIVSISNFVGYMLDTALNMAFDNVLIVGHTGKLIKVAAGIFHTHSKVADGRMETLCTLVALEGGDYEVIEKIYNCNTTDMAEKILKDSNLSHIWQKACEIAKKKCCDRIFNKMNVGCIMFNNENEILGKSKNWSYIINELR
ncbi:cobalt-precorrin-5B (C(1))-methyltransferase CbiD [Tyzzerella sp. An114]|uniref:cobalt-precorrin-5B (C(1))-methyltransferase CbiD n=1 Tax=Tyzzerella sp. An114 TaxID=1965545 RepID=UPI0013023F98|nr:cobalt-precorrin-5B (C(1))-methyltransferase CbiD [Tyzzerella sp. An114]